jgi:predicted PurR-regulated permease PerM
MQKRKYLFYTILIIAAFLTLLFFYSFRLKLWRVILPFLLAVPITYIVKPLSVRLQNRKIPCGVAILMVYLFFMLALAAACIFFFPELINNTRELLATLPDIMKRYEQLLNSFLSSIQTSDWSEDVKGMIFREVQNGITLAQDYSAMMLKKAMDMLFDTVDLIVNITISMVVAYYFIKDSSQFRALALSLVPRRWRNGATDVGIEINGILSGFIQGQLLTALIVGAMESIGLMLVQVRYPLVLGMIGGLANIIPYFGPYIGVLPALAVALIQSPIKVLWVVVVFLVVQQIDNSFISPKIIEGKLGLHPVATIFAVLVGGEFFGILGMLLAVPAMAVIRVILRKLVDSVA